MLQFDAAAERCQGRPNEKLSPISKILDAWVDNLKECYVPSENVTVDEQLVILRGRCPFKQYIYSMPVKNMA